MRALPVAGWLGIALLLLGLVQMPLAAAGQLGLVLVGLGTVAVAAGRPSPGSASPVDPPSAADTLEQRVEALKDSLWELRESEARYRDLLDTQAHVIARRDGEGRLTYVNRAFCRLFGVDATEVLGKGWMPSVLAEDRPSPDSDVRAARGVVQLVETSQGPRWLSFEQHAVPGDTAERCPEKSCRPEIQIVGTDITQARASAAALAEARDQALAADRAKSRFLASMSHEIRTPMNGIMGMASLLSETRLSAEQRTYLDAIDQSARTLLLLIDEILDFSKIEAGRLVLATEPLALDTCVQSVVELMAPTAHIKGLEIAWTIDAGTPVALVGDAARVRQIVLNLVGNAVKFTDRGGVLVSVSCDDEDEETARIAIRVQDTGIGLSEEALGCLFGEFNQADNDVALRRGGTGLGLAISMRLARAMGGDITVDSELGRGATFTVKLMLGTDKAAQRSALPARPAVEPGAVLLAFDSLIERRALGRNLAAIGLIGVEADEPLAGGEIEAAAAAGRPIRFVVCDAVADPAEAASVIEHARKYAPDGAVRGFLLIDSVTRPGLEQFRAAGFTSYLVRPVRPQALAARFSLDGGTAPSDEGSDVAIAEAEGDSSLSAGRHVLLAEDNAINALLATRMLEKAGCSVVHVGDGEQALGALDASLEDGAHRFDLILMDVHMPRLDGLAAVARMRAQAATCPALAELPPVVALTANAFNEDRERFLAGGFDDYLAKPFHKADLLALLDRCAKGNDGAEKAA